MAACETPSVQISLGFLKKGRASHETLKYRPMESNPVVKRKAKRPRMPVKPRMPETMPLTMATKIRQKFSDREL